ncbi:bifunctional enoyl-CoA hydratase/phosphate acetyltransferase [Aquisalinus flavus]|uniref:Phosphate acetyltransferase n=1 Tax=Aquisalinus flavus TaxID=1526572 RepID=A0A8J2V6C2_9PROT|nr:bifunctional enoyl-CoA hydratase/phosphate acetyltransferase [Aquisalinus flavus]MBD0426032.1 bifunctional enoyl-CoA hydratase/phosphate acetyltransferase [Aquisalinus flavus]UNE48377.1 bifunctional enoyl-CoA hydratase/phosphate acetyltransferase [Aquisalinus flavus]GGD11270.1 phosphate acetyltransferase [Aquisalinus flavus]
MAEIGNLTYDEITVGQEASEQRVLTEMDIALFAAMSGDVNPAHLDPSYARETPFHEVIAHGMWGGSLISALLGTKLPGPGTIYVSQNLSFLAPVKIGDAVTVTVRVTQKAAHGRVHLDCLCRNQDGDTVIEGQAVVIAPREKIRTRLPERPRAMIVERGERLLALIEEARSQPPLRVAVVHPVDAVSLEGMAGAVEEGLIDPVLVGPRHKIESAARLAGIDISSFEIVDTPHSHGAAERAVALAREDRVDALMKGALHTDEILSAVVCRETGLRTERRISHVFVMDTPAYEKLLFITDAAINITPGLEDKKDILQNAIDLCHALKIMEPKAAILAAVETVSSHLSSTLDAAALCKMSDRGQITGAIVDGPLAFDNAISAEAARLKNIDSPVAGCADILLVPNLEAGNMLAKQLDYLAGAVAAGIVLGAGVPIILTSRAEGRLPRVAASAVANLFHHHRRAAKP